MRAISWRFWAALAGVAALWLTAGLTWADAPANVLFDIGSCASFFAAFLFIALYTILGLRGPAKWWRNDVGTFLVLAFTAQLLVSGVPAFAVIFNQGMIDTRWWAWSWIGGHYMSAVMILGLSWLWLRHELAARRNGHRRNGGHEKGGPASGAEPPAA